MSDNVCDLHSLFVQDVPLLDVRAPVEFASGAFPHAVNYPLMNDTERHQVGICYKQKGQDAAIALGHKLVSGNTKAERITAWSNFAKQNPEGVLYCFRGGLRSKITQEWLRTNAGISYPRVAGGYKAMRQFLMDALKSTVELNHFMVVGGLTGSGKTEVINQLKNSIDLEAHANHRGSSFGKKPEHQPCQIDFENRIAIDFLKKQNKGITHFCLEDEGRFIGQCALPLELHTQMKTYPVVWLEENLENRVQRILNTYVVDQCADYTRLFGEEAGFEKYAIGLTSSLGNINKRLGSERHQALLRSMTTALEIQKTQSKVDLHLQWIEPLMTDYFDPMYSHQKQQKSERIKFRGNQSEVIEYLMHWNNTHQNQ